MDYGYTDLWINSERSIISIIVYCSALHKQGSLKATLVVFFLSFNISFKQVWCVSVYVSYHKLNFYIVSSSNIHFCRSQCTFE